MTDSDYDIFGLISTLSTIAYKYPAGSTEQEAIERAQVALFYVNHLRQEKELSQFYREFLDPNFKISIEQEFATPKEADAWLASAKAAHGMIVKIAGKGFQVAEGPGGRKLFIDAHLEVLEKVPKR